MIDTQIALQELSTVKDITQLDERFQKYLGKTWILSEGFKKMGALSPEEKKDMGKTLSDAKIALTEAYEDTERKLSIEGINQKLNEDIVDISLDGKALDEGSYSLLARIRRETEEVCKSMGFTIEYGTEMVTKFENFESVNIPLTHPATEMHDTIYLQDKDETWENLILRTHTSSMQNFLIQKYGLPLKAVVPSKVYRFENMDATHDTMFYQLEWMIIDKGISIAHFKDIMGKLLAALLQRKVETRMRPAYFPFVEPGFEIDVRYEYLNPATGKQEMSKWMEILGAGMIHPNVLKTAGVDPTQWSWIAFGIGITRLAAVRYGIKDIRILTNGDLRFAKSFA